MAQRHAHAPVRRTAKRASSHSAADRWLLLLGIVTAVIVAAGMIGPWPFATTQPETAVPLTMAEARASNAAIAIERDRRGTAARFRFRGGPAARDQAVECLATAALYEVGTEKRGQKAVIQVILNRVRAPGFPTTICGVVYQGYARITGCQFSFTCDGSFNRRPVHVGWAQARKAARRALAGYVFADVGKATHYHADWMVPYWRSSLVKVSRVGSHLFYVRGKPSANPPLPKRRTSTEAAAA